MTESMADLNYPADPFAHGFCRWNTTNGQEQDCPNPAVFPGGSCAMHAAAIALANRKAGYDAMGKFKIKARKSHRDKAKVRAANKSRARNRR